MTTVAKYKLYPKYKRTSIEWLGDMPETWKICHLWTLGNFSSSGIDKKTVEGEPLVQMVNYMDIYGNTSKLIDKHRDLMKVSCPEWKRYQCNLQKGDLVFTPSSETIEDIGLSSLILDDLNNTVFSYHVVRFRFTTPLSLRFKRYLCNNTFVLQQFSSSAKGTTRQILDRLDFKHIVVLLPPENEQQAIADYLDNKTALIDDVIAKKQKLIELLKEKRQALITHAVTKGIDPNAKLKSSDIDWLGDIPEAWEVKRLKYVARSNTRSLPENTPEDFSFRYLDIGNVGTGYLVAEPVEMVFGNAPSRARRVVFKDETIISTVRTYLKAIYHFESNQEDLIVSTGFAVIKPEKDILPKYFYYLSLSENFIDSIVSNSYGVSYPAINESFLMTLPVWYPSWDKQQRTVEYLDHETAKIDSILSTVKNQIGKLKEYRQALITSAVTGKFDVRGT